MFHNVGDWRGSFIQDLESGRRQYLDSEATQRRRWRRAFALARFRDAWKYGTPVLASILGKRLGMNNPSRGEGQGSKTKKSKKLLSKKKVVGKKMVMRSKSKSKKLVKKGKYKGKRKLYKSKKLPPKRLVPYILRSALAVPKTLIQEFSSMYGGVPGGCAYLIFDVTHSLWHYSQLRLAAGQAGNFITSHLSNQMYCTRFLQKYVIANQANSACKVSAMYCTMRRDFRDSDYAGTYTFEARSGQYDATDSLMQWIYQSYLGMGDAGTDAKATFAVADSTNNRLPSRLVFTTVNHPVINGQTNAVFKVNRVVNRVLKAGEHASFSLNDFRVRKIVEHIHASSSGNNSPHVFGGRSKFILFKITGQVTGTSEAPGAANDDLKIDSSSYQIGVTWTNKMTLKVLDPYTPGLDISDYRPDIAEANQEFVGDANEDPIAIQEV